MMGFCPEGLCNTPAWPTALARRSRPGSLQAGSVWTAAHHRICRSTASWYPVLTQGGICVPPTVTYLPYRVSGSTLTAVGHSQLLARWPGTHSQILAETQRAAQTVFSIYLKSNCSHDTSASSALGVLNNYVLYKSMHSLTHSKTPQYAIHWWVLTF